MNVLEYAKKTKMLTVADIVSEWPIDERTLRDCVAAGYVPHSKILDNPEPLFQRSRFREWFETFAHRRCSGGIPSFAVWKPEPASAFGAPASIRATDGLAEMPMPFTCNGSPPCVYFLCHLGQVVYVGQTVDLWARTATHCTDKVFDSVWFVPCPSFDLDAVEQKYIEELQPRYNGMGVAQRMNERGNVPKGIPPHERRQMERKSGAW